MVAELKFNSSSGSRCFPPVLFPQKILELCTCLKHVRENSSFPVFLGYVVLTRLWRQDTHFKTRRPVDPNEGQRNPAWGV